ncbi:MAG TPA: hypothetical protein EYP19_13285 [Desulfobacterales bacterium]|jgi:hypothetical protein|nr:hypothetical protein [Desulfobacterales bacterium]
MNDEHLKPLSAAVLRLFRPLVRILLRNGVSYRTFSDLAKWVYVDVATKEFDIKGRKQSTSRVSVITGLSRKEVKRMRQLPRPDDRVSSERYNRAARVIAAWRRESNFLDAKGKPAPLPMVGSGATFSELAKRFSGDVPARAILDELIRVGAVEQLEDGRFSLLTRAYIPESSDADKLHILGTDVGHLISTIDHNLKPDPIGPFLQLKVAYDNLPDEILPAFRRLSAKKAQSLLESLDRWLAQRDRDVTPTVKGSGRNQAGLGIYYFEEPYPNGEG